MAGIASSRLDALKKEGCAKCFEGFQDRYRVIFNRTSKGGSSLKGDPLD